jgi:hypothetical protein
MNFTDNVVEVINLLNDVLNIAAIDAKLADRVHILRMKLLRLAPTNMMHNIHQRREASLQFYRDQYERQHVISAPNSSIDRIESNRIIEEEDEIDGVLVGSRKVD